MSSANPSAPRKPIFNGHLLQLNDKQLKFYLDGYNSCEFHALTKILEAYGGRLTVPDKDTIIFAESDRPVQKYYYRYDIKFVYDCVVKNRMQNIHNYLLPTTSDRPIKSEPVDSAAASNTPKTSDSKPGGTDSSTRTQENLPTKNFTTLQNHSMPISSCDEESRLKFLNTQNKTGKRSFNDMSNSSVPSMTSKSPEEIIICISDDSDPEPPKLVKSPEIDLDHKINDDVKRQRIEDSGCTDVSTRSNPPAATIGSDQARDSFSSRFSSSSGVNLNDSCGSSMNGTRVRMVARKSTTKNAEVVIRSGGGDGK